ncbi:MAG: sigma-70 family RNA polymerase sigma factor [Bacteroidota bacterium]
MNKKQEALFEEVVRQIGSGDEGFAKQLYQQYKDRFVSWFMKQYKLNQQEGLELYHRCFLVFYYQVKRSKLTALSSSIETYLFGIGKKLMMKEQAKERIFQDLADAELVLANHDITDQEDQFHQQLIVRQILKNVTDPCKSILTLYYFRNFSLESIANRLGYQSVGAVKKKKSLCLKNIRKQLKNEID